MTLRIYTAGVSLWLQFGASSRIATKVLESLRERKIPISSDNAGDDARSTSSNLIDNDSDSTNSERI